MPRTRPPYPAAFRQQILELAHSGRTPAELSREFGVTAQTISNWVAQDARDHGTTLPGKEGLAASHGARSPSGEHQHRLGPDKPLTSPLQAPLKGLFCGRVKHPMKEGRGSHLVPHSLPHARAGDSSGALTS